MDTQDGPKREESETLSETEEKRREKQESDMENDDSTTRVAVFEAPELESLRTHDSEITVKNEQRDSWGNNLDFIMTCLSTAVGLGNVWRFPFIAVDNGGGAFLVPYLLILIFVGRPLYLLELSLGQFASRGALGIWSMVPLLRGVGYAQLGIGVCTILYYLNILSICFYYFIASFTLPWGKCDPSSYDMEGKKFFEKFECTATGGIGTDYDHEYKNTTYPFAVNNPALFYHFKVLRVSDDIDDGIGTPILENSLCYLAIWIFAFLTVSLGARSVGKGAYFTAIFPYIILLILFGRAVTLDGAGDGILYFFKPQWDSLLKIEVWYAALGQCFFSLGVGYGNVITYGSYNRFNRKIFIETTLIAVADTATSVLAGSTVFAILGSLAASKGTSVKDVALSGSGLAFISYPEVILRYADTPYLAESLSVIFFAMFVALGVGSGSSYLSALTTAIYDRFPTLNTKLTYKIGVVGALSVCFFFIGLIFCTHGGAFMVDLFDVYSSGFIVYVGVCFELIGISYIYGMKNFIRDMKFMNQDNGKGTFSKFAYKFLEIWGYVIPIFLVATLIYSLVGFTSPKTKIIYSKGVGFSPPAVACGWILFATIVSVIPGLAIKVLLTRKTSKFSKKVRASLTPTRRWGPNDPEVRKEWVEYKKGYKASTWLYDQTVGKIWPAYIPPNFVGPETEKTESYATQPDPN